jgi:hypothetical protein
MNKRARSTGADDESVALLATAAKRLGIPEERLREWIAEGRATVQQEPKA